MSDTTTLPVTQEQAVMVCPQCEGEGGYPDGLDEAACHEDCPRCGTNGWIVDLEALRIASSTPPKDVAIEALRKIAEGNLGDASWQANYDRIREVAREALSTPTSIGEGLERQVGFQAAVRALRSWAAGFSSIDTRSKVEAMANDLENNRAAILANEHLSSPPSEGINQ